MRLLIAAALILTSTTAFAQTFSDEALILEGEVDENTQGREDLMLRMDELEARINQLESDPGGSEPDPDPNPLPPITGVETGQDPFVQTRIPGYIQAENYDLGGNGVAYLDLSPGNVGGVYRADDVDIKAISLDEYNTGWNADGEWTEHTVGAVAGTYDVWVRYSNGTSDPKELVLILDTFEIARVTLAPSGGWANYTTVVVRNVPVVRTGNMVLRFEIADGPFDVDWVRFVVAGTASNHTPTGIIMCKSLAKVDCEDADGDPVTCVPDDTGTYCVAVESG